MPHYMCGIMLYMKPITQNRNYLATTDGHIFSKKYNRVLKGSVSKNNYIKIQINCLDGVTRWFYVHRLIAETFIPNPDNKKQVNHKDGNRRNNNLSNLEWVTQAENLAHASKILGRDIYFRKGEGHCNAKLNQTKADEIRKRYKNKEGSFRSLAKEYGVSHLVICKIMQDKIWRHTS